MTTITKEWLQQIIDGDILFTEGQREMARMLLASMYGAQEPVAWTEKCEITNMQATGLYLRGFPDNSQGRDIPLYAAPQPLTDTERNELQESRRILAGLAQLSANNKPRNRGFFFIRSSYAHQSEGLLWLNLLWAQS